MNRTTVIAAAFLVVTGTAAFTPAQTRPAATPAQTRPAAPQATPAPTSAPAAAAVPAAKIALVDTTAFADQKAGIKRYLNAVNSVQRGFDTRNAELRNLQSQVKAIADEITKLSAAPVVSQETIQAKQDEGERLQRELKYKKEQADADFQKKYVEVVGPVSTDIGKAMDQYASQRGFTMVLDLSKLLPALITWSPATDITAAFIADYNSTHP
ncbi:MAG TPA: OmpH family outer membrane protein [Pyrinomonadaceae bacterium]|jgi:Skp family chaperone for outer membrane proteins|nr:OmpH family outer membrane protein [Pyrinomonadaceae bacterium]